MFGFLEQNLDIVFFFYGLTFVILGIAIVSQLRVTKESGFILLNVLWLLASFGFTHGANEFIDMFTIIKPESLFFEIVGPSALLVSYAFIFLFGYRLININKKRLGLWFPFLAALSYFILCLFIGPSSYLNWTISARYFFGFPGAILSGLGLIAYYNDESKELKGMNVKGYFIMGAISFFAYGILGGLIVPEARFFPASLLNNKTFIEWSGIPVQFFRAVFALSIAWSVWQIMDIFNQEERALLQNINQKLKESRDNLETKVRERTSELIKTNELLKDEMVEHKQAEEALKESKQELAKISESAYDAIVMVNDEEQILFWNRAAEKIFGYSREEALGRKVHSLIMPTKYHKAASKGFQKFITTGQGRGIDNRLELSGLRKDGSEFPVELSLSSVRIKDKWNAIGLIRDTTEQKRTEEEIKHMAYYDSLTGLPNRKMLHDRFNQALAISERNKNMFALLFIDLDEFKIINDRYGHHVGDLLLKQFAKRLVGSVRKIDTVARIGGDEFAIILSRLNRAEDAAIVAHKILIALSEKFSLNNLTLSLAASIGISIFPTNGKNLSVLLLRSDKAMYRAKATGKNKYQFYSETNRPKIA